MGTRAQIARPTEAGHWEGVYLHWDGYPTANGERLFNQVVQHYMPDNITGAWRDLIYAHRTGYSTLADDKHPENNECYCHARGEGINPELRLMNDGDSHELDWTYVLAPKGMHVFHWDYGLVVTVPWDHPNPPWQDIEDAGGHMDHSASPGPVMFLDPITADVPPATPKEIEK